ncbi:MAG: SCP2 sterol-binding domain-containing protein [Methanomassiliicoccales archaeon]
MTLRELLNETVSKFNKKILEDEKLRQELVGIKKRVLIDLGEEKYNFMLENCMISQVIEGEIPEPDITVISDPVTFEGVLTRKIKPMKAWALRKIVFKGSIEDLMHLRSLLQFN